MGTIGAVEDAMGAAEDARDELDYAASAAEREGRSQAAAELRVLCDAQDDLVSRIGLQREALRA